jgi:hypothetical protein
MQNQEHETVDLSKGSLARIHEEILRLAGYVVADAVADYARQLRERKN